MKTQLAFASVIIAFAGYTHAQTSQGDAVCQQFGPQTPRDIDNVTGENTVAFPMAPPSSQMNLCNIHFHVGAEHKAAAFSIKTKADKSGHGGGYQCGISTSLSSKELAPYKGNQCKGIKPGDTVEFHWVHSTCDVAPGPGLGSCLSSSCANPSLRVETQVFTVVNDASAMDFSEYATLVQAGGYHQPQSLPSRTGKPVQFLGSTTGPKYTEQVCSPMQVTWSVRPQCAKVSIASLSKWCESNVFNEKKAHGVRELVTNPKLLSPIQ